MGAWLVGIELRSSYGVPGRRKSAEFAVSWFCIVGNEYGPRVITRGPFLVSTSWAGFRGLVEPNLVLQKRGQLFYGNDHYGKSLC